MVEKKNAIAILESCGTKVMIHMEDVEILPEGVCCKRITLGIENDTLRNVKFEGGCNGNGQAVGRLLEGMPVAKAIEILTGVNCTGSGTSCTDQLARGLARRMDKKDS